MGLLSHRIKRSSLEVGDHIYAWRFAYTYSHHGIYTGHDRVIHFTTHGVICTSVDEFLSFWKVGRSKLRRYKYSSKRRYVILKPRGTCTTADSDDGATVVHRAKQLHQNGFGSYNLRKRNCENFAVYCKTGLFVVKDGDEEDLAGLSAQVASLQCKAVVVTKFTLPVIAMGYVAAARGPVGGVVTRAALAAFSAVGLAGPTAFAIISGGIVYYCKKRCDKDIGIRSDVRRKAYLASTSHAASASASASFSSASSEEEEEEEFEEEEEDYQNWTTMHVDGADMEAIIPSPSLQLLSDLSRRCVPQGYYR